MIDSTHGFGTAQEKRRTRFVVVTIFAMLLLNVPAAIGGWGWKSAAFNTALVLVIYVVFALRTRDVLVMRWLLFGVFAGLTELAADYWLVTSTKSLVYPVNEPHLVVSPAYMPFAWALVLVQSLGIADWLRHRMSLVWAALVTGLISGVNIPLYEHLAKDADWWYYQATPMLFNAPYYIILGEFLVGLPLVWLAAALAKRREPAWAAGLGIAEGLVIFGAYVVAWWLVGPCVGAVVQFACG